jgi:hypothetical protein
MGAQAQQPVYYDTETSQYYTMNNKQGQSDTGGIGNIFGNLFQNAGMPSKDNPFYAAQIANRNYLGSPYGTASANRFIPKNIPAQYPEMNMLFPALNAGLAQGLMSSTQPDGAMYGAGRFLAPQTTSESKGK